MNSSRPLALAHPTAASKGAEKMGQAHSLQDIARLQTALKSLKRGRVQVASINVPARKFFRVCFFRLARMGDLYV